MMLPILISASLAPVSYFFCASEGAVAKPKIDAEISAESTSLSRKCGRMKRVQTNGFAQRVMCSPFWARRGFRIGSFLDCFSRRRTDDSSRAGSPEERDHNDRGGRFVAHHVGQSAALQILQWPGGTMRRYLKSTI